jgi:hypothetical protein
MENSEFRTFMKIETLFIMYFPKIQNLLPQNCIYGNTKHIKRTSKCTFLASNKRFWPENVCFKVKNIPFYNMFCEINTEFVVSKLIFFSRKTRSDSNSDSNIWVRVRYAGPYYHLLNVITLKGPICWS